MNKCRALLCFYLLSVGAMSSNSVFAVIASETQDNSTSSDLDELLDFFSISDDVSRENLHRAHKSVHLFASSSATLLYEEQNKQFYLLGADHSARPTDPVLEGRAYTIEESLSEWEIPELIFPRIVGPKGNLLLEARPFNMVQHTDSIIHKIRFKKGAPEDLSQELPHLKISRFFPQPGEPLLLVGNGSHGGEDLLDDQGNFIGYRSSGVRTPRSFGVARVEHGNSIFYNDVLEKAYLLYSVLFEDFPYSAYGTTGDSGGAVVNFNGELVGTIVMHERRTDDESASHNDAEFYASRTQIAPIAYWLSAMDKKEAQKEEIFHLVSPVGPQEIREQLAIANGLLPSQITLDEDHDGDGKNLLMEFAFNEIFEANPQSSLTRFGRSESGKLTLNFRKPLGTKNLDYVIEVSQDLKNWERLDNAAYSKFSEYEGRRLLEKVSVEIEKSSPQGQYRIRMVDQSN